VDSTSEEVVRPKPLNQIVVINHELVDGKAVFLVKLELGEKKVPVQELEDKYPKQLALYLYNLINS
jgi:hypothetical protein